MALLSVANEIRSFFLYGLSACFLVLSVGVALALSAASPRWGRLLCSLGYTTSLGLLISSAEAGTVGLGVVYLMPVVGMATTARRRDSVAVLVLVVVTDVVVGLGHSTDTSAVLRSAGSVAAMGVMVFVSVHGLRQRLSSANVALQQLARTDPLSGLANRRGLRQRIERRSPNAGFAMMSIDVNGLKQINDTLGHASGDDLIRLVSEACESVLRRDDYIARVGGDEFVVFLDGPSPDEAHRLAERLRKAVAKVAVGGHPASVSVGVAIGAAGDEPDAVLAEADARMYADKVLARQGA